MIKINATIPNNSTNPNFEEKKTMLVEMFKQFRKSCFRVYTAGLCPTDKFGYINPAIGGFAIVNIAMRLSKFFTYISLSQTRTFSHLTEKQGQLAIHHTVLSFY